ncbi:MAG: thrombospondin type 3 repeat-containing protein [Chitinophagaceae bacterium]
MNIKTIIRLFTALFFATSISPIYAQNPTSPPSKYDIKKDGDGDGVKNKKDKCLTTPPGVTVDGTGCPLDTDKDGVADYLDKCPTLPGTVGMNGCQDKDKDGVSDNNDLCPDVPGLTRFKGCPDSDGDGIEDSKDKCPNAKGTDMFAGCPDTDGDGVQDAYDKCPATIKGMKVDVNGCNADSDNDGVFDTDDKCPDTKSNIKVDNKGCPADTDGDGVTDDIDKCPGVRGDINNNGCPLVKKEIPKRLQFATRRISFEKGNAILKTTSYPMLDEVVNILKEYPDYNLRIGGHADAVEKNPTTISQSRADAVKSYLMSKGVSKSRTATTGFSKTRPFTSNANETGRGQNRRVELELYLR